jgi:hypothetical protein
VASEGGSVNPANVYVGVVELFSILLPGAILIFLLSWTPFLSQHIAATEFTHNVLPDIPGIRSIIFLVASYVTGHFLRALGYFVMVPFFKNLYTSRSRGSRGSKNIAAALAATTINGIVNVGDDRDERFRWSMAYLSYYSVPAAARLDGMEAQCKFFRNLAPTICLSFPLIDSMHTAATNRPTLELLGIVAFFLYTRVWTRAGKSLILLFLLLLAPLLVSIIPIWQKWSWSHVYVNLGLYGLMLLAGIRYLTLQRDLMTSADEFLVVLFSKRPEGASSGADNRQTA